MPYSPFNIAYYQVYFDVDTSTVLKRVMHAMIPKGGFIADACDGQMDLYGGSPHALALFLPTLLTCLVLFSSPPLFSSSP